MVDLTWCVGAHIGIESRFWCNAKCGHVRFCCVNVCKDDRVRGLARLMRSEGYVYEMGKKTECW